MAVWTGSTLSALLATALVFLGVAGGGVSAAGSPDTALAAEPGAAVAAAGATDTIFGASKPHSNTRQSDTSVEVGLRFTASVDGTITRLRVYRPAGQTAAQQATLWSATGTRLAGLSIPATSTAGWRSVALSPPVAVTRNTIYVVSYHTNDGYVFDANYFNTGATPEGLVRPAMIGGALDPHNGVYRYGSTTAFPTTSYRSTNYWIDVKFISGGGPPVTTTPPTSSPPGCGSAPLTCPPTTSTSTTTRPGGGTLPPDVAPTSADQVGFLGDPSTLRVINSAATAPSGTSWNSSTKQLRVDGSNVVLDGVYVKGDLDVYSGGTLTVRDSIIEAQGLGWSVILMHSGSARLDVRDSTILWPVSAGVRSSTWGNGCIHGDADMTLIRNNIFGCPDGIQQAGGNTTVEQNYVHGFVRAGSYPNNTHNDGIQLYGGPNTRVAWNAFMLEGYDGTHQNGSIFVSDDGGGSPGIEIVGNYLGGGGFQLRLERGTTNAIVTDNIFGPLDGGFGFVSIASGASAATWTRNVDSNGNTVSKPN